MVAAAIRIAELMIEREQAVAKIGPVCELDKRSRYAIPGAYLSQDDLGQLGALCVCRADRRPDNESQRHPAILTGHSGALEQALDPSWVAIAADRFGQPVCGAPCVWARGDLLDDFAGDCLITRLDRMPEGIQHPKGLPGTTGLARSEASEERFQQGVIDDSRGEQAIPSKFAPLGAIHAGEDHCP